jgi:hypothetical protein
MPIWAARRKRAAVSLLLPDPWPIGRFVKDRLAGVVYTSFQGELRVETQQVFVRPDEGSNQKPQFDIDRGTPFP